jgi:hypothetical protein
MLVVILVAAIVIMKWYVNVCLVFSLSHRSTGILEIIQEDAPEDHHYAATVLQVTHF